MNLVADALIHSARARFGCLAWRQAARHAAEARQHGRAKEADLWVRVACALAEVSEH